MLSADGYSGEDNVILLYNGHLHYFRCPMETNVVIESNLDDPDLYIA